MRYSWVVLAALASSAAASSCYYPDGSKADDYDYEPCGNTDYSTCCYFGEGDKCLSNGLCSNPGKYDYYRAACANEDWSNCPHACMDEDPNNWLGLTKCGDNKYCCPSGGDDCCTNGAKIYTLSVSNSTDTSSGDSTETNSSSTSSSDSSVSSSTGAGASGSGHSTPPAGAIAGGVVGGVLVIGFLGFGFCCFRRREKKKTTLAAVETGSAGGSGSERKPSHDLKPALQPSLAEIEGSRGNVWNETDGKPVVGVRPAHIEERRPSDTDATRGYSQQGIAEVEGGGIQQANQQPVVHYSTMSLGHHSFAHEQRPSQGTIAEVDGGTVNRLKPSIATTFDLDEFETILPQRSHAAEMDAADIIRPDSGTLVPDSPTPRLNGFDAMRRPTLQSVSELDYVTEGVIMTATSGTVISPSTGHKISQTTRPTRQTVADKDNRHTLELDLGSFSPVFDEFEESCVSSSPALNCVPEVGGSAAEETSRSDGAKMSAVVERKVSLAKSPRLVTEVHSNVLLEVDGASIVPKPVLAIGDTRRRVEEVERGRIGSSSVAVYSFTNPSNTTLGGFVRRAASEVDDRSVYEVDDAMKSSFTPRSVQNEFSSTQDTLQREVSEVDGQTIVEADSRSTSQTEVACTKEVASGRVAEVDGREIAGADPKGFSSASKRTLETLASSTRNVAEADGSAIAEADSTRVDTLPPKHDVRKKVIGAGDDALLEADSREVSFVVSNSERIASQRNFLRLA